MAGLTGPNDRTGLLAGQSSDRDRSYSSIDELDVPQVTFAQRLAQYTQCIHNYIQKNVKFDPLLLSSIGLILFTATERITFKIMIDRMLPYKFVLVEIIFLMASALFSLVTIVIMSLGNYITTEMRQFPQDKILNMAVLDTIQFLLLVYSGAAVSPTMTVILMHTSTLFVVLGSKAVFPNRHYSWSHTYGLLLMAGAILFSLAKILYYDSTINSSYSASYYAMVYVMAACLQGVSTLYKENALASWSRPINLYYLSAYLFLYQFFVAIVISVLFYLISALVDDTQSSMLHSFYYGWLCFLGNTPSAHDRDDDLNFYVSCHDSLWLILGYVLSTFLVLTCLNVVLERYSQGVPRLLCAAIVGAFVVLWVYDAHFAQFQPSPYIFGGSVGAVDLLALVLVVVGNDVYGRDPEPDVELITHYTPPTPSRTSSMNSNTSASSSGPSAEFVALTKEAKNMAMHN